MKATKHIALAITFIFLLANDLYAQTTEVRVEKIAYCRTIWPICNDTLMSEYHWWEDYGVPDQIQKNTYIGRYNEPSKSNTRHLVFLAAGQRFGDGQNNLITGQPNWSPYGKQESSRIFNINTGSIAYRILNRGIYDEADTFIALGFDARFNWGFSPSNKNDIVNAYYAWLKSKVYAQNLESVYLAGHSRGGALVLRLAQKFQQEFPDVAVIVHAFDPVVNMKEGELGAYNSSINNPVAGYPRDTALLNNKGNWSWKSNFHTQFSNKSNLSIFNFLTGGKIFGLAQEVRSVTHETGFDTETDLAWYFQLWFDVAGDGEGHNAIAVDWYAIGMALDHLEDRLAMFANNIAPLATASASSTYCSSSGLHCYSAANANDMDLDSRVGGYYSWTNSSTTLPQWIKLSWPDPIRTDYIELVTSEGYPLQNFSIQYLDGSTWRTVATVTGNTSLHIRQNFTPIQTRQLRILATRGPNNQSGYVRVNEILVRGDWVTQPNIKPTARCTATPNVGQGVVNSTLSGSNSTDPDGSIVNYSWTFSDGGTASGATVQRYFSGISYETRYYTATLTVRDDDGASSSASCQITVYCYSHPNCN